MLTPRVNCENLPVSRFFSGFSVSGMEQDRQDSDRIVTKTPASD